MRCRWNGSESKDACSQSWKREFGPWKSCGGRPRYPDLHTYSLSELNINSILKRLFSFDLFNGLFFVPSESLLASSMARLHSVMSFSYSTIVKSVSPDQPFPVKGFLFLDPSVISAVGFSRMVFGIYSDDLLWRAIGQNYTSRVQVAAQNLVFFLF